VNGYNEKKLEGLGELGLKENKGGFEGRERETVDSGRKER